MPTKKEIDFMVATDLDYYGSEATKSDPAKYAEFAKKYLRKKGYNATIKYVTHYPSRGLDGQYELRQEIWEAFCK